MTTSRVKIGASAGALALGIMVGCASTSNGSGERQTGQGMGGVRTSGGGGSVMQMGGAGGTTASGGGGPSSGGAIPASGGGGGNAMDATASPIDASVAADSRDASAPREDVSSSPVTDSAASDARAVVDAAPVVDRTATLALMRRVADFELTRIGTTTNNNWVRAAFYTGLMTFYGLTSDARYLASAQNWGQANAWSLGPDSNRDPRFADNQACIQTYSELYLLNPVAANQVMLAPARTVLDQMVAAPRAGRVEWWWCDALFMAPPAFARMTRATGNQAYVDLMHTMWWDTTAFLFDPAQQLFWRDGTFVNTGTYWARGNGWVVAGIARVLQYLAPTDPRRADYEGLLRTMAGKLRTIQGSDGYWRSSLTVPSAFPNPESSGTAFFTFGLAWGINQGILDRATYLDTVRLGWQALVNAVNAQGMIGWVQPVGAMPGPATINDTNDYAYGAFLLAGNEMLKL